MGTSTMFGVMKGGDWYSFQLNDWFDVMNSGCLTSNQNLAEDMAKKEGGKVAILQISVSCMYNPSEREHA